MNSKRDQMMGWRGWENVGEAIGAGCVLAFLLIFASSMLVGAVLLVKWAWTL